MPPWRAACAPCALRWGDSGQAQRIIQTQRGYGYRFVADLALLPEDPSPPPVSLPPPSPAPGGAEVRPLRGLPLHQSGGGHLLCGVRDALAPPPCTYCGQAILLPAAFCPACGATARRPISARAWCLNSRSSRAVSDCSNAS